MAALLETRSLSKSFPGVLAVDDVSFELQEGEILAIVGENGAGKSTLMKILGGVERPDTGKLFLQGVEMHFSSPLEAIESGISMVFQELSLVGSLSVAENIFANRQPVGTFDLVKWEKLHRDTAKLLSRFNMPLNPRSLVKHLSIGNQQILEILKAISTGPKVLILDEPTSSLTESERDDLFENMRRLRLEGMTFIYITHKLEEVFAVADRVMVMRDGVHIDTRQVSQVSEDDLVRMMVGRGIEDIYGDSGRNLDLGESYFELRGFTREGSFWDINMELRRGEILGLAGLVGAGRTALGRAIFGIDDRRKGEVYLEGRRLRIHEPQDAIRNGIAYLTEDRKEQGLFLEMSVQENIVAPDLRSYSNRFGFLRHRQVQLAAQERVIEYGVVTPTVSRKVRNLSGGNQQKCMLAMWMGIQPRVVIADEPTRGVDVGARADIYHKLREMVRRGIGIIMISSDLQELLGMCDRIVVLHQGRITGQLGKPEFSEERIMGYAAGIRTQNSNGSSRG